MPANYQLSDTLTTTAMSCVGFFFSALLHSGKGSIDVFEEKEFDCKPFPFIPAMSSDDVRVQLSVRQGYYDTAVTWVESVSKQG